MKTLPSIHDRKERMNFHLHGFHNNSRLPPPDRSSAHFEVKNYVRLCIILRHIIHMIKKHKINVITREITFAPHYSLIIVIFHMCCINVKRKNIFYCVQLNLERKIPLLSEKIVFSHVAWLSCARCAH